MAMSGSRNSALSDTNQIHANLSAGLPPEALNSDWQTEEQVVDLINNSRKLDPLSNVLSPALEIVKKLIGTIAVEETDPPKYIPAAIVYGTVGRLLKAVTIQSSLVRPTKKLLESLHTQLDPFQQYIPPSSEPKAAEISALILNRFATLLTRALVLSTTKLGSRLRTKGLLALPDMFTTDKTIVDALRELGWFVEDLEWLSRDPLTMNAIAWNRGQEKFEARRDGKAESKGRVQASSTEDVVCQLEGGASRNTMSKETKRLIEAVKKLGPDIEVLLKGETGDRGEIIFGALSTLITETKGKEGSVQFITNVLIDLQKRLPNIDFSTPSTEDSTRLLLHVLDHLAIALRGLYKHDLHLTLNHNTRSIRSKESLSKTSSSLHESFSKLDHLKSIHRTQSLGESLSQPSTSKFEEMWDEAISNYTKDTGKDPTHSTTGVKSLDDLKEAIKRGQYDFIRARSRGSETREILDPIVRFLSRHTTLASEIGSGLGLNQTKTISSAMNILFESAKAVTTSYDQIEQLLRRINDMVTRFKIYTLDDLRPDPELREVLVEELCQVLHILGIATKGVNRSEKFMKTLANQKDDISTALDELKEIIEKENGIVEALMYRTVGDIHRILKSSAGSQPLKPDTMFVTGSFHAEFHLKSNQHRPIREPALPPPSAFFLGRHDEIRALIESVLKFESSVIRGPGGIGKTSLSLQILHDEQVRSHFARRLFVRCEETPTLNLLYTSLADSCGVPLAQRDQLQLEQQILSYFRSAPTLLCLDNFETLWDIEETRYDVEQTLRCFVDLPTVSILVTMRGSRKPGGIPWSRSLPNSLAPLSPPDAFALFQRCSGCDDDNPYAHQLVEAMESIPLAVELLAYQADGEDETTEELWHRWGKQGTSVVSRGQSGGRHLDLNASIELSLNGPRIRSSPMALHSLALLSILPGGLDKGGEIFAALSEIEELVGLLDSLRLLSDVALAFLDSSLSGRRYRVLAPIARFARQYLLPTVPVLFQQHVTHIYIKFMEFRSPYIPEHHQIVPVELTNSHSVIQFALDAALVDMPTIVKGILSHTRWITWLGAPSADFLLLAIQGDKLDHGIMGHCYKSLGKLYLRLNQLDEAETSLLKAVKLHRQAQDISAEGRDKSTLGKLYLRLNRLDEAETSLLDAVKLHRQTHDVLGEGSDKLILGELYLRQDQLDEAERSLLDAVKLHRQVNNVFGEGTGRMRLGELYLRQDRLNEAEKSLLDAVKLHQQAHAILGEGSDKSFLGGLYLRQDRLDEAEKSLMEAVKLHQQAHDGLSEGSDKSILGELYLRQDRLDAAEKFLLEAVKLHQQANDVLCEGSDKLALGELYLRQDRLDEAEKSLLDAAKLHQQAHDVLDEGSDRIFLGQLYLRQGRLDEAETFMLEGMKQHQQAHAVTWEEYASIGWKSSTGGMDD